MPSWDARKSGQKVKTGARHQRTRPQGGWLTSKSEIIPTVHLKIKGKKPLRFHQTSTLCSRRILREQWHFPISKLLIPVQISNIRVIRFFQEQILTGLRGRRRAYLESLRKQTSQPILGGSESHGLISRDFPGGNGNKWKMVRLIWTTSRMILMLIGPLLLRSCGETFSFCPWCLLELTSGEFVQGDYLVSG